jgi:hypothetical protein
VSTKLVTIHLPMDMAKAAAILFATSEQWPDGRVAQDDDGNMTVVMPDDDDKLRALIGGGAWTSPREGQP